uniref:tRNA dimethylallyltransferase n=1 Tax=Lygus hesperus TaxID=30085 RepID=A0A0A9W2G1_LYGHE
MSTLFVDTESTASAAAADANHPPPSYTGNVDGDDDGEAERETTHVNTQAFEQAQREWEAQESGTQDVGRLFEWLGMVFQGPSERRQLVQTFLSTFTAAASQSQCNRAADTFPAMNLQLVGASQDPEGMQPSSDVDAWAFQDNLDTVVLDELQ